jgi:hypothetical protein
MGIFEEWIAPISEEEEEALLRKELKKAQVIIPLIGERNIHVLNLIQKL